MATKKKWKKRALLLEQQNHDLFRQAVARAEELARIDVMLHDAEFPGPTIEAYVAQVQQFLQRLVEERKLTKKSSLVGHIVTRTEAFISEPASKPYLSIAPDEAEDNGEYAFLEPSDVNRLGDATRS